MMSVFIGIVAFVLFYLYDFNQVIFKQKILNSFFFIGCLLLMSVTILLIYQHLYIINFSLFQLLTLIAAIIFFILLIYTLFFSLPFEDTYLEDSPKANRCCQTGIYALCRHPGVLWLFGFYLMLSFCFDTQIMWQACFIFNMMNLIYVVIQDKWTFMYQFSDYGDYKKQVPFLLPNQKSIKRCIETLKRGGYDET